MRKTMLQNPSILASIWIRQVGICSVQLPHLISIQAPLTVQSNSPLEMVHQLFVKLGARYVVVTDVDGDCKFFRVRM